MAEAWGREDERAALRALTRRERVELLRSSPSRPPAADDPRDPSRLERWRSQPPFDRLGLGPLRAAEGLTGDELTTVLTTPAAAWAAERSGDGLGWWRELAASYRSRPTSLPPFEPPPEAGPAAALVEILHPLLARARSRLRDRLAAVVRGRRRRSPVLPFDPESASALLATDLPLRLFHLAARTLVLELHVARVEGRLEGDTSESRFASFVDAFREPAAARALFGEYPVLGRRVVETLDRWVETGAELLARLAADWPEVLAGDLLPAGASPGALVEIAAAGDSHRGGRTVALLCFEDGSRLVYKPRSLAVDRHFQELLDWLGRHGVEPGWRRLGVLDRGSHGWMEFVAAEPCADLAGVRRFHLRLGGLLAVLYLLEASDCHFENLIAAGEHPVLVDLETLFHPHPPAPTDLAPELVALTGALSHSVLRVGLLPFRVGAEEGFAGADVSGLGKVEGDLTPDPVPQFEDAGTDRMHAVRRRLEMPAGSNRVRLADRPVDPLEYAPEMEEGFRRAYRFLERHRDELREPGGALERFADDPVRAVLRATRGYHLLLHESHHPDLLREALDRDLFLDRLWVGLDTRPHLRRVVAAEHRDLVEGDIPFFTSRPGSREVETSRGETVPDFFPEPAMDRVRERLAELGTEDLDRQLWLLRTSLSTLVLEREKIPWPHWEPDPEAAAAITDLGREALAAARRVGRRLEELTVRAGDGAAWLGLEYRNGRWMLSPLGEDLYSGTPGILLFLAALGAVTGEGWPTELARAGLTTLRAALAAGESAITRLGAFQGWGGLLYTWIHLAALWRDEPAWRGELEEAAAHATEEISEHLEEDGDYDVIAGAAGALAVLLAWLRCGGPPRALEVAVACGQKLLAVAEPAPGGIAWHGRVPSDHPPTGFSHGASGIGWALAELAAVTADRRFADAARAGFAYERSRFVPELGNWLDPDDPDTGARPRQGGQRATSFAWCYGAPGIGLARLASVARGEGGEVATDLRAAVEATRRHGVGFNHCLCHGDLGNLELLRGAAEVLGRPELADEATHRGRLIVSHLEKDGPLCGTPMGSETPGLMNGLAGIGWGLLRWVDPTRVPSVLTLDPPPRDK